MKTIILKISEPWELAGMAVGCTIVKCDLRSPTNRCIVKIDSPILWQDCQFQYLLLNWRSPNDAWGIGLSDPVDVGEDAFAAEGKWRGGFAFRAVIVG